MGTANVKVDFGGLKRTISRLIAKRMAHDHLDMDHKKPEEPKIVVEHFQFTAESVLFSQLEQYLEARTPEEREQTQSMMIDRYRETEELCRKYDLSLEFRSKKRLDKAVDTAHKYLEAINGKGHEHDIYYMTMHRKSMSGQLLMEYFIADIMKDAYQHVFKKLGIEVPDLPPTPTRRVG
jgi:DNA-directed RNA polymerase beta subunit